MTTRIVILGGGFGGVYTAYGLDKKTDADISVTLISRNNFFLFTPMLSEIAAASIDTRHSVNALRQLFKRVNFMEADVTSIDFASREVEVILPTNQPSKVGYDHLVIALGSVANYFGIPGVQENALSLKSLEDAMVMRNRVVQRLEEADVVAGEERRDLLTFVVVGGGLAGVELTGDLNDFIRGAAKAYKNIRSSDIRVILVEAGPRLMTELSDKLGRYALNTLRRRGVSVELNAAVESVTDREVRIKGKGTIETRNLIWTAGAAPTPFVRKLGVELKKGRLPTDEYLRVTGLENVWAVGDVAAIPDGSGGYYPPTAQHAMREGGRLAKNILNTIEGRELQRFRYATLGMMSTVGLNNGVIESFNFTLSGYPAWFLWRTYYLFRLPRIEKRIRVLLDWTLDLFFPRDIVQIQMSRRGRTD